MNTLSKYDIADIVSQISGNMQPTEVSSSEGHSFADLLKEAIKNVPETNAEVKVAESGKRVPQSPLIDKEIKGQIAAESVIGTELQALLQEALSRDSDKSVSKLDVETEAHHRSDTSSQDISDLIANFRSAFKFRAGNDGNESVKNKLTDGVKSENLSEDSTDEGIRVATLKDKRPVILGPGSYNDKLKSQVISNYFEDDKFLKNQQTDSQIQSKVNLTPVLADKFKDSEKQTQGMDKIATDVQSNLDENSSSISHFSVRQAGEDLISKESVKSEDSIPEHRALPRDGQPIDIEKQSQKLFYQQDNTKLSKHLTDAADLSISKESASKEALKHTSPVKRAEAIQTEVRSRDMNVSNQLEIEQASIKSDKETINQTSKIAALPTDKSQKYPLGAEWQDPKTKLMNLDPQEFDPKIQAYLEGVDEFQLFQNQTPLHIQDKDLTSQNLLRSTQMQSDVDNQNLGASAKFLASQRGLISDIERKFPSNELRQGFDVENFDTAIKSSSAGGIESGIQIHIGEQIKNSDTVGKIIPASDLDLTIEESDSSVKAPTGEKTDALKSEPLANLQSEKPIVSNRSELVQRTVAVSNFSSGIKDAIMGQLTKNASGTSKFTVALFPENLGKISIEISYSDLAGLKITMVGDNPEATKILEQNLPTLRENLQTDKLNELLVNLNNNKDSNGSNQKYSQSDDGNFGSEEDRDIGTFERADSKSETYDDGSTSDSETGLDTYV